MVLAPGQPIPHGRQYLYHLNGPVHMMIVRKRVGLLPTHRLAVRHLVDYSSLDHFSLYDSSSDSSSSSSSETSSDSSRDFYLILYLVVHVLIIHCQHHHRRPSHDSSSASRSRKRSRSPVASVPLSLPTIGALSYARADLLQSPKRIRSLETSTDLEDCSEDSFEPYVPREVRLEVDFEDESSKPSRSRGANLGIDVDVVRSDGIEIDLEIQAEINECFAYADALRDRGIDARVVVEAVDQEESETGTRGLVKVRVERVMNPVMLEDIPEPAQWGAVEGHMIIRAEMAVTILTDKVAEFERDNRRLRGTMSVEIAFSDDRSIRNSYFLYFEINVMKMPNTRSGASMTRTAVNEQSDRRVAEALRVRDAVGNLGPLMGDEVEQEEVGGNRNGGNGDGGNGNGNGKGGEYGYNFRGFM
ncbi:hypothetical protein Tco_1411694, partial [Tanacetum coccineum]